MAKKKYYAVRRGVTPGIYQTWNECQAQINGYSNAEYKSFPSLEEAEEYLSMEKKVDSDDTKENETVVQEEIVEYDPVYHVEAYVDGSFNPEIVKYSFGCIIITPNGEIIRESGSNNEAASVQLRNVAGEMLGAMYAVKWAINNGYKSVRIYHDYTGISCWANHEWKAKNPLTIKYQQFMDESAKSIQIMFEKVEAHTGVKYNEEADKLAKKALTENTGIPKVKRGDFWYTVENITQDNLETVLDLVIEELGGDKTSLSSKTNKNGVSYTIVHDPKEKVVVNHYSRNDKIVIQGKPEKVFSTIISYITELVDFDEIPDIFNSAFRINVDKTNVSSQFQSYLPNAYDKLPPKLAKTLHQAVYNLNLTGDLYDATFLAQPVIRGVDGHLKNVILTNISSLSNQDLKNGYSIFDKVGEEKYVLNPTYVPSGMKEDMKRYIGRCYSFFHRNRNVLSHWDDPTAPLDTTKLLDVHNAHDLIKRTLTLIDEYYEMI